MGRVVSHIAALAVVFVFLMIAAHVWFPASRWPTREELAATERAHVEKKYAAALRQINADVAAMVRFPEVKCQCGRDAHDWAMISVTPAAVAQLRRGIVSHAHQAGLPVVQSTLIKSDDDLLRHHAEHRPAWWTPTKLADAEIVAIGEVEGSVYVFSEKTGTIYVMSWTV